MRRDAELGFMVPGLKMWFRWDNDTLVAANEDGQDIPDTLELVESLDEEKVKSAAYQQQSEELKKQSEAFEQQMVSERTRADREQTRANEADRRAEELATELRLLRRNTQDR